MSVVQLLVVVICMSWTVGSSVITSPVQPNAVVSLDGTGQFMAVMEAVASAATQNNSAIFIIFIKAGLYVEQVLIPKHKNNIVLIGEGPFRTIITGNKNNAGQHGDTYKTATVSIEGANFMAMDIAFENTAGPDGEQAVALRVSGDRAIFYNVHVYGYQDTLYADRKRQFYRDCSISGTIDFVFGDALAFFQNCAFVFRKPKGGQKCMLTAQGRQDPKSSGAFVIQTSNITAEAAFLATQPPIQAFLGRPWKALSRTIIMQSYIGGFIAPQGWSPWQQTDFGLNTCFYGEYQNYGPVQIPRTGPDFHVSIQSLPRLLEIGPEGLLMGKMNGSGRQELWSSI